MVPEIGISVCVPALNEAGNIADTITSIQQAAKIAKIKSFEIIIVNDGSTDETAEIVKRLQTRNSKLILINNSVNQGMGVSLRNALNVARYPKFMIVPGDNDMATELIKNLMNNMHRAELIIGYFLNREVRGIRRNIISVIFASIYMITFRVFVQYINGPCIYPTAKLKGLHLKANRFSIIVEATLKLLKSGCTFFEVGGYMQKGLAGSTSLSFNNFREVFTSFIRIFYEIKIKHRKNYLNPPLRAYD